MRTIHYGITQVFYDQVERVNFAIYLPGMERRKKSRPAYSP